MTTHTYQTNSYSKDSAQNPTMAVAVIIGLILAVGFNILWQGLPFLAVIGMGLLGLAISFIGVTILQNRNREDAEWGLALVGQVLGMLAVSLIFFASIM